VTKRIVDPTKSATNHSIQALFTQPWILTPGSLRVAGLIAAGPRSPQPGAPYAYVTTAGFLGEFGFESLRDLPDIEKLEDAGLLEKEGAAGLRASENRTDGDAALLFDLAPAESVGLDKDELEEDAA
jgi:Segregation and condensation complex subunit ScpB